MNSPVLLILSALLLIAPLASAEEGRGHDHGHDHEEESHTEIKAETAQKAGVEVAVAAPGAIAEEAVLTGRVVLNGDTTLSLRGRFPGIVREVPVRLGQKVEAGQTLAVIDSNMSLQDYTITSPVSGVLLERNTNPGDVVGDLVLFVVADLSTVWAKFHIFPKDTARIREGQKIRIHTFDHAVDMETESTVKLLLPTADALSQTHLAVVEIGNEDGRWRPGLTVDGHALVSEEKVAVAVPEDALQTMEGRSVLFVQEGERYEARTVQTGRRGGGKVEILGGLKPGERYVAKGSFIVKADIMKAGAGHDHAH